MDAFKTDDQPVLEDEKKYYDDLVGEGKKFSDPEKLARAKVEADAFIARLIEEKRELEASLSKRNNEEEFLTKLEQIARPQPTGTQDTTPDDGGKGAALKPEDIEALVAKKLAEAQTKSRGEANLEAVTQRLQQAYGSTYKAQVQLQAQTLGLTTEYLTSIAAQNPAAFYRLMGIEQQTQRQDFAPPRSSVHTQTSGGGGQKDYNYYKRMREEKGEAWYFSKPVQREIWEQAKANPNFLPKG